MKPSNDSLSSTRLVEIAKPIYGEAFLARIEGKAVFVPLVLPGEQVRIRVAEDKRGYATAEAEEIVTASPQRIVPRCPHFGACGGCHYQHTDYTTQLAFKQAILRETLERGGVQPPAEIAVLAADSTSESGPHSHQWSYRNRIRLAFDAAGNPGYRGRRSHAVIPITECPVAAPVLIEAALAFAEIARPLGPAFRPAELALFCNADETALLASVFTASPAKLRFNELAQALHIRIPALKGAELVIEAPPAKHTQPPRTVAHWGADFLTYGAAGFEYRVDNGAFFQVNRWLVDALVECVTAGHTGTLAWDLFAGVGLFARRLTTSFGRVVAVESAPSAVKSLEHNLRGTTGTAVRAVTRDFLRRPRSNGHPSLIVVDPPRTGLGPEICSLLASIKAPNVVYVSCDPATLARDLRILVASGYSIDSIALADLFPQTFHLETVVQLHHS